MSQRLTTVQLCNRKIGQQGGRHLATTLQCNKVTLTPLFLILHSTFFNEQSVTTLDLGLNQISDQGAQYLCYALQRNQVILLVLSPSFDHIHSLLHSDSQHIKSAAESNWSARRSTSCQWPTTKSSSRDTCHHCRFSIPLSFVQTLTRLNLHYNSVGDEGAQYLANALQQNRVMLLCPQVSDAFIIQYRHSPS